MLYVPTPKVACTSLKWWFVQLLGISKDVFATEVSAESDPELVVHDALYRIAPDVTCIDVDVLSSCFKDETVFRFCLVRNPYQRIFSAWQSKLLIREPQQSKPYRECAFFNMPMETPGDITLGFEAFLQHLADGNPREFHDPHWMPQVDLLQPDTVKYSCIARVERKDELISALNEHLGPNFLNPFDAVTANESLLYYSPQFFTKRAIELIKELYAADFEYFGYSDVLPDTGVRATDAKLDVALRAVRLIRGRHERLAQVGALRPSSADHEVSVLRERITHLEGESSALLEACTRLQAGTDWLEAQRAAWENCAGALESHVAKLKAFIAEQREAIEWHANQAQAWERRARELERAGHADAP
ncbi:hypothetical protein WL93_24785 [Burkholderia diffusa]|nr:hypothetical protein WL93_24785 [Burkholderia diffusa]